MLPLRPAVTTELDIKFLMHHLLRYLGPVDAADIRVTPAPNPAFLDRSLTALACRTLKCSRDVDDIVELIQKANANNQEVFVLNFRRVSEPGDTACYELRYALAAGDKVPELVRLVVGTNGAPLVATVDGGSLEPFSEFTIQVNPVKLDDLRNAWGEAEAAKQVGEAVIALMACNPPANLPQTDIGASHAVGIT